VDGSVGNGVPPGSVCGSNKGVVVLPLLENEQLSGGRNPASHLAGLVLSMLLGDFPVWAPNDGGRHCRLACYLGKQ
jgi:hypothetical protein